ncbi:ABC transporter ATP-binding protein [Fundicoccus culcitae]|uniref:ATP-binding cassette domain-containing protein n=1 Tax=Fundicoccus culcitae TaxID=2969821 RepID=A0ABY5P6Q5_9LACT|nr:ATP-binding cassette domain-containing protein [Fundicoccus culcitae]UUX34418.1 ATP-binding cassette domain-containing protein [Fundicoccus culcitae]
MSIITVENLSKSYGSQLILNNVNFEIHEKGIIALIGPNGSGKTTLINSLLNLTKIDKGTITILGSSHDNIEIFNKVSLLKDYTVLYPYLSGWDHLSFAANAYKLDKERVDYVINRLNIQSFIHKKTKTYSLGMKQILLIALAILNDSQLMILDEPLNGLDPSRIIEIRELLIALAKEGKTIFLSSHTLLEVEVMTKHVLFLKEGKLYEEWLDKEPNYSLEERYREIFLMNAQ